MSIDYVQSGAIGQLILNNPEKHNAFNHEILAEFLKRLNELETQSDLRVLILKSQGAHFSAGADLAWMQKVVDYSEAENRADSQLLADLMSALYHFSKPTIALVQGAAYGGANGLIACCDLAIATPESRFCFSETKLGIIPAVISPYVIAAIGERAARRYFLTAEVFDASVAKQLGLIHEISDRDQLETQGQTFAELLLKNGPEALKAAKRLISAVSNARITPELIDHTVQAIAAIRVSPEGQEGLKAFLEKRKPRWMDS